MKISYMRSKKKFNFFPLNGQELEPGRIFWQAGSRALIKNQPTPLASFTIIYKNIVFETNVYNVNISWALVATSSASDSSEK
jgi:hypothetical protein